jgi:hypothetical protein
LRRSPNRAWAEEIVQVRKDDCRIYLGKGSALRALPGDGCALEYCQDFRKKPEGAVRATNRAGNRRLREFT